MIDFKLSSDDKNTLLRQLERTQHKCEHLSQNVMDQERNYNFAEIPSVTSNRAKAKRAFQDIRTHLEEANNMGDLCFYFQSDLAFKKGLFYRIFRGRVNKHFTQKLDNNDLKSALRFTK